MDSHSSFVTRNSSLIIAAMFGLVFGGLNYLVFAFVQPEMDFWWSIRIARDILSGVDPYAFDANQTNVPYPLPVFVIGLPFLPFSLRLAGALFSGLTVAALVYAMQLRDEMWRLPMLLSFPFVGATIIISQWSPLVMVAWYFPILAPYLVLVKPQNALPVALAKWHWIGIFISANILGITLLIYPTWPWRWLEKTGEFEYIVPFLAYVVGGPLILLAARHWRNERGRLLLLMGILPLRAAYDLPLLWLVAEKRWQVWTLTVVSWLPLIVSPAAAFGTDMSWSIPLLFLPALFFLYWNHDSALFDRFLKRSAISEAA